MSDYQYNPSEYLVSAMDALKRYTRDSLVQVAGIGDTVDVEMGFPDTRSWTKASPLERSIVHFELDDDPEMRTGFGVQVTQDDQGNDTTILSEAAVHELNFDIGIWTSPQSGGTTMRARLRQALFAIYGPGGARRAFTDATGVVVKRYGGGNDVLDRVNDLPIYRTVQVELVLSVFSRHTQDAATPLVIEIDQDEHLSIVSADGSLEHVRTDEDQWT